MGFEGRKARLRSALFAALAAMLLSGQAVAQDVRELPEPDEVAVLPLMQRAAETGAKGDRAGAIALVDQALEKLPRRTRFRGVVQCTRGVLLFQTNEPVARQAYAECYELASDVPAAQMIYAGLLFHDKKLEPGTKVLIAAIKGDPRWMDQCDSSATGSVKTWLRQLEYADLDALRAELIETLVGTACGRDDPAYFSGMMRDAIRLRLARGEVERARSSLPGVVDPEDVLTMLADRRFEPIWGDIDRWTGGTLEAQREAFIYKLRVAYTAAPTLVNARRLAYALQAGGRAAEGITLLRAALADPKLADNDRFESGITASRLTTYLNDAGEKRAVVAIAPLLQLMRDAPSDMRPGLWNVVPNLVRWQIIYDQPAAALRLLDRYVPDAGTLDAPEAAAYFSALRGCAQLRVGDAQGDAALAKVLRDFPTNAGAQMIAAMCGSDKAKRRAVIVKQLDDPDKRGELLLQMARLRALGNEARLVVPFEDSALLETMADPDVAAKFAALGRDPGASYRPALAKWRKAN
jgi:hypothetical protein